MGRPHKRLLWLDITDAGHPVLVWQEGDRKDYGKVKDKDRLPLIEIIDIKAGQVSPVFMRSGTKADQDKYMTFAAEERTLDVEAVSTEARDWMFKKFADLFQAYATAQMEGLKGDDITLRVADIIDNGAVGGSEPEPPIIMAPPTSHGRARSPGRDNYGGSGGGGGGYWGDAPTGGGMGGMGSPAGRHGGGGGAPRYGPPSHMSGSPGGYSGRGGGGMY